MGFGENAHFITEVPIFTPSKEDANNFKPWFPVLACKPSFSRLMCKALQNHEKQYVFNKHFC